MMNDSMKSNNFEQSTRTQLRNIRLIATSLANPYFDKGIKFFTQEKLQLSNEMELEIEEA